MVWHEKMVFGMYVMVWHFLAFLDGAGMKKQIVWQTSGSVSAVGLELYNFFSGQMSSLFYHGPILEDKSGFAILSDVTGPMT